jgi:thiol-disulfide isomerase/thioredoxin
VQPVSSVAHLIVMNPIPRAFLAACLLLLAGLAPRAAAQARVPSFAVVSLDDSTHLITDSALRGSLTLIDFWASWCPPCVEEIPVVMQVWEEFHAQGFRVLSLSFDRSPEQVRAFRARRYSMPWWHGFVERGFGSYLAQSFGVENIPRQLLVDADGAIVATDEALRGERLRRTVMEHLPR